MCFSSSSSEQSSELPAVETISQLLKPHEVDYLRADPWHRSVFQPRGRTNTPLWSIPRTLTRIAMSSPLLLLQCRQRFPMTFSGVFWWTPVTCKSLCGGEWCQHTLTGSCQSRENCGKACFIVSDGDCLMKYETSMNEMIRDTARLSLTRRKSIGSVNAKETISVPNESRVWSKNYRTSYLRLSNPTLNLAVESVARKLILLECSLQVWLMTHSMLGKNSTTSNWPTTSESYIR